ncbi:MAG: hypothetical protein R2690_19600 [Acidimicrobiales bacterium]
MSNLLRHVMGDERFTQRYLTWLYDECPDGDTVAVDIGDERPDIVGHGAAVPVMLRNAERRERFVQIVNIAVAERGRGNNVFATQVLAHIPYVLEQGAIGGFRSDQRGVDRARHLVGRASALPFMQLPLKVCPPPGTGLGGGQLRSFCAVPGVASVRPDRSDRRPSAGRRLAALLDDRRAALATEPPRHPLRAACGG